MFDKNLLQFILSVFVDNWPLDILIILLIAMPISHLIYRKIHK
ncbi:hypothetical protein ACOMCP_01233 [Lactiplantibacillus plantarum]|uniref:Uncharacterized protein n=1 Tax=Lactiplantibacillus plantarum TaxID=1590 RepID=A0A1E3KQW4_LACPN|nr:hypothetical protein LPJSA22_01241 [Lactiplantibacillus plantarum]